MPSNNLIALPYPQLNGNRISFCSLQAIIAGAQRIGLKALAYGDKLEPGIAQGTSVQAIGRTAGIYTVTASFELYREDYENLRNSLGAGFMLKSFDIEATYAEQSASVTITDSIAAARIMGNDLAGTEGADPMTVKCDLHVISPILWNGVPGIDILQPPAA